MHHEHEQMQVLRAAIGLSQTKTYLYNFMASALLFLEDSWVSIQGSSMLPRDRAVGT
jgi:hypothetical protein